MSKIIELSPVKTRSQFVPDSVNEKDRSLKICIIAGSWCDTGDEMWSEADCRWKPVKFRLNCSQEAVVMDRVNNGLPLIDWHKAKSSLEVFGRTSGLELKDGQFYTTIFFDDDEESEQRWQKAKKGIVQGYSSSSYPRNAVISEDSDFFYRDYIKYEPYEVSMCPINADPKVIAQSSQAKVCQVEITQEGTYMSQKITKEDLDAAVKAAVEKATAEAFEKGKAEALNKNRENISQAMALEGKRRDEINSKCTLLGLKQSFATKLISEQTSLEEAVTQMFQEKQRLEEKQTSIQSTGTVEITVDEHDTIRQGAVEALMHRQFGHDHPERFKITDKSRRFANNSMLDICRQMAQVNGRSFTGMSDSKLVKQELDFANSTKSSDLTAVLSGFAERSLLEGYKLLGNVYDPFVKRIEVDNFNTIERKKLTGNLDLVETPEFGEISMATLADREETYRVKRFTKGVPVSIQMIKNDDLGALSDIPFKLGQRAANLEHSLIFELLGTNPVMNEDKKRVFSAEHGNFLTGGGAMTADGIESGWLAIALVKDENGGLINIRPKNLVVPASLRGKGRKILNPLGIYTGNNPVANDGSGIPDLNLIYSPFLDDYTKKGWWLMPDKNEQVTIELARQKDDDCYLALQTIQKPENGALIHSISHCVGAAFVEWRGTYYSDGLEEAQTPDPVPTEETEPATNEETEPATNEETGN